MRNRLEDPRYWFIYFICTILFTSGLILGGQRVDGHKARSQSRVQGSARGGALADVGKTRVSLSSSASSVDPAGVGPNLRPFRPTAINEPDGDGDWSSPLVVSNRVGTVTDDAPLTDNDTLFIDWAVVNDGTSATPIDSFVSLFVNGVEVEFWRVNPLDNDSFVFVKDFELGSLSPGMHELRLVADIDNDIAESNENDNTITRNIVVKSAGVPADEEIAIFFPSIRNGGAIGTGVAVANPTGQPAGVDLLLIDDAGNLISGPGITNPAFLPIPASQQVALTVPDLFGAGASNVDAWILARSANLGIVGFFLTFEDGSRNIDGAEAVARGAGTVVFPEIFSGGQDFTELNILGAGPVTLELRRTSGSLVQSRDIQLPGQFGRFSSYVSDIFSAAVPAESYVLARSGQFAIFGYETFGSGEFLGGRNAIPVEEFARQIDIALFAAQLADLPGILQSTLTLINPTDSPADLTLTAFRTGVSSGVPSATANLTLGARAMLRADGRTLLGLPAGDFVGWLRIDSDISGIVGDISFGNPDRTSLASVQLQRSTLTDVVYSHVADGLGFFTGLTFLNVSGDPANVIVEVFNQNAQRTGVGSFLLRPFEHFAQGLPQIIPGFQPQIGGNIRVTSSVGIFSFEIFTFAPAGGPVLSQAAVPPQRGAGNVAGQLTALAASSRLKPLQRYPASRSKGIQLDPELDFVPGEVIVRFKSGLSRRAVSRLAGKNELTTGLGGARDTYLMHANQIDRSLQWRSGAQARDLKNRAKQATLDLIEALNSDPDVLYAEPNYIYQAQRVPNDEFFPLQWHYPNISLPNAWDIETGAPGIIISVIDTGARFDHPDLAPRLTGGQFDMISDPQRALDGDGIDGSAHDPGDDPLGQFSSFHGTHVAGTVGAVSDNGLGVAGVNWVSPLMTVRVLGNGGGTVFDITQGVLYSARRANASGQLPASRAHVINMSLGGEGFSQTLADAVADALAFNVTVVAAAGNENTDDARFPADLPGVVNVGATDLSGGRASYSNFGIRTDVVAPGGDVSQDLDGDGFNDGVLSTHWSESQNAPNFNFLEGTSMASPHVAGIASLILSINPNLTPAQVRSTLQSTAIDIGLAGFDNTFGFGLVNPVAALLAAGGQGADAPILVVSTNQLNFGTSLTQLNATISNGGSGSLAVNPPSLETDQGAGWLSAGLSGSSLTVQVNRAGLPDGDYAGRVQLTSNGGTATVEVAMRVGAQAAPNIGGIFVLVIDPLTFQTLGSAQTGIADDFRYRTDPVPSGNYFVVAGTDSDGDNFICDEPEDLCGFYPITSQPVFVNVQANQTTSGIDFRIQQEGLNPSLNELLESLSANGFRIMAPSKQR